MYFSINFLSTRVNLSGQASEHHLASRSPKGGGGGGRGGGGGSKGGSSSKGSGSKGWGSKGSSTGSSSKGSSSGSSGSSSSSKSKKPLPLGARGATVPVSGTTFGSGKTIATAYGNGNVKVTTIPQGQPYAGRTYGGGTRDQIYGTSMYGSGYPGMTSNGVAYRNFPYVYQPVVWVDYGYHPSYLHSSQEYHNPDNTNRTGGPEMQATFGSPNGNSTFHIVSDNSTITSLLASISTNCTGLFNSNSSSPYGNATSDPLPESAIQYYRASTVVLTLDGYNNTAALSTNTSATPVPLPANIDTNLLNCLNATIGEAVPLISSARSLARPDGVLGSLVLVLLLLWHMLC